MLPRPGLPAGVRGDCCRQLPGDNLPLLMNRPSVRRPLPVPVPVVQEVEGDQEQ
mgnify:CR=1 FL=1